MMEVRLAAGYPRFVHTNFELAVPRDGQIAVSVVILVERVKMVGVIVLSSTGNLDQRVDYSYQQDQDPRGEDAGTGNTRLHLKY